MLELRDYQIEAINNLKTGSVLCGGVGTGKSRTSIAYYFLRVCEGSLNINGRGHYKKMKKPRDLYIITTAKKRDSREWEEECIPFHIFKDSQLNDGGINLVIDSWNNIKKYRKVIGAFFIFDEQRVVGSGAWVKAFLDIARKNDWILLSATPGDTWSDYIPVFVANGFYKNKTEFINRHVVYSRFAKYPKIDHYFDTGILLKHRGDILVPMECKKPTKPHDIDVLVGYDKSLYLRIVRDHWDIYDDVPIKEAGKACYLMRKVVNSDESRIEAVKNILEEKPKCIIFYNYDYELELLQNLMVKIKMPWREWNGQKHQEILKGDRWVYLVQYLAGAEGWNCITTDTIIFYSQSYSYRTTAQAAGRIDRMNTPFEDLYYYRIRSHAPIDIAILKALKQKKNFNERSFLSKNQFA